MKYILSFCALIFLFSCTTQKTDSKYTRIQYQAGACFGSCPIFTITINPDRTAILEAEHFNFSKEFSKGEFSNPREGTFNGVIKEADYNKLISLLNDLDVKSLKDHYGTKNITDLSTSYLKINFTDGSSKNIEDYGKRGSEKLRKVYMFIEDLRHNQQWAKVK
ncbi:hypothetical protein B0A69_20020 [Chryseobacterium shigense]|uniref:DUF6438 domain-containing protein n=1 Tax=Chryseobacterium shigense TaxID=297244 RepID=A0A1N7I1L9_9FLAO|nr:DUF6438 domain-containing protein [Chryseobacterium shigense]PQA90617.1 hypothetical protein B0A69_20020 [Chryseobacterium shigense]SIS30949.1 hypothetical protein SAMN05421639_1011066 [Chryseobacterium shigense]